MFSRSIVRLLIAVFLFFVGVLGLNAADDVIFGDRFHEIDGHEVVVVVQGNGSATPTRRLVQPGTSASITLTPSEGHTMSSVTGCSGTSNDTTYQTAPINQPCTITAVFEPNQYTITFDSAGGSAVGSITQDFDTNITAPANPTRNAHTFTGWSPSFPNTMPAQDLTLTAQWAIVSHNITPSVTGQGSIDPGQTTTASHGQSRNFTLTPDSGHRIASVGGTCGGSLTGNVFSTNAITEACTVVANFEALATQQVSGHAFKGPFRIGSSVAFYVLDSALQQTGTNFSGDIINNEGAYSLAADLTNAPVEIEVQGSFFNEVSNAITSSPVSLRAIAEPTGNVNINVISALELNRVRALVGAGQTFSAARSQALTEILGEFGFVATETSSTKIDLASKDTKALLAVTATLLTDTDGSARTPSELQEVITVLRQDLADGALNNTNKKLIVDSAAQVNAAAFTSNLNGYFQSIGSGITIPGFPDAIDALLASNAFEVSVSSGAGGSLDKKGNFWLLEGSTLQLNLAPDSFYEVLSVGGTCGGTVSNNVFTSNPISSDCDIAVAFDLVKHLVTPAVGIGGSISPSGAQSITHGASTSFTITVLDGYSLASVSGCGGTLSGNIYSTAPITGACAISIGLNVNTYTLSFDANGGSSVGPITQAFATPITAPTAPTREGHDFVGWSPALPTTMPAGDQTLTAQWQIKTYPVAVNVTGNGQVSPSGPVQADHNELLSFTITPDQDHEIDLVSSTCGGSLSGATYTTTGITAACVLDVTFTEIPTTQISGEAFKGPFQSGSTVTLYELDDDLDPTGRTWPGTINENDGTYSVGAKLNGNPVLIEVSGTYFNEATNSISDAPVALKALASPDSPSNININALTDLEVERVKEIKGQGKSFGQAKQEALAELMSEFGLGDATETDATQISLNSASGGKLLAITGTLLNDEDGTPLSGVDFAALMNSLRSELKTGGFSASNKGALAKSAAKLNPATIKARINQYFQNKGSSKTAPDFGSELEDSLEGTSRRVTISTSGNGTVSLTGVQWVPEGESTDLTITPDPFHSIANIGGSCGGSITGQVFQSNPITTNCSININFQIDEYTITFDSAGGSAVVSITQDFGTSISAPVAPTRIGYVFTGWDQDIPDTMPGQDLTITAKWQATEHTVTITVAADGAVNTPNQFTLGHGSPLQIEISTPTDLEGINAAGCQGALAGTYYVIEEVTESCDITISFFDAFYLNSNGITVECPLAKPGDSGAVNGKTYIKRTKDQITEENAASTCTSGIEDLSYIFAGATNFNQDISHWDTSSVTTMKGLFSRASRFNQPLGAWDTSSVADMSRMFAETTYFNQDISAWSTSSVQTMSHMFWNAEWFNQPINSWDVSQVTDMEAMFLSARAFNQPLDNWDVSKVTDMSRMFSGARWFNQSLSSWDVSSVTTMQEMFSSATAFNGDVSTWNTENVTTMHSMFLWADSFNQPIATWDVSKIAPGDDASAPGGFDLMFYGAQSFNQNLSAWCVATWLDGEPRGFDADGDGKLLNWTLPKPRWGTPCSLFSIQNNGITIDCSAADIQAQGVINGKIYTKRLASQITPNNAETTCTSGITDMSYMFSGESQFNADISHWDTSSVTSLKAMFSGAEAFNQPIGAWNISKVNDVSFMFKDAHAFNQPLNNWETQSVTTTKGMFENAHAFNQNLGAWVTTNVIDMSQMFKNSKAFIGYYGGYQLSGNDLGNWDVSSVQDMSQMFMKAASFRDHSIFNWDTSNVKVMDEMFHDAVWFNGPIGAWNGNVSSVLSMERMFQGATSFDQPLAAWNVGNVTNMESMFQDATSFNQTLNAWNVGNVITMKSMFQGATSFNQALNTWDVGNVTNMESMFQGATSFNQALNTWDVESLESTRLMFKNASNFDQDLGDWRIRSLVNAEEMFASARLSQHNYDSLLIGWSAEMRRSGVILDAGLSEYTSGAEEARTALISVSGWTIHDLGKNDWKVLPNGVVTCRFAAVGSTKTLNVKGLEHTYTKRNKEQIISLLNADENNPEIPRTCTTGINDMSSLFKDRTWFNQDISSWDISNTTSLESTFENAARFNKPLSAWDTSSVTSLENTFKDAKDFNQELGTWDTSSVISFKNTFKGALNFNQNLGAWDTSSALNMHGMFHSAEKFQAYFPAIEGRNAISYWNTSSVTDMGYMFYGAKSFAEPNLHGVWTERKGWDTSKVRNMDYMFYGAREDLTLYNLYSWCVPRVQSTPVWFHTPGSDYPEWYMPVWGAPCTY